MTLPDISSPVFHIQMGSLLTVVVTGGLGIFTICRGWRDNMVRLFGVYSLFICGWCFCYYQMTVLENAERVLFYGRFLHCFSTFIPATFLHFVQHLCGIADHKFQIRLRRLFYVIGLSIYPIIFHPSFIPSVSARLGFKHYIDWGPAYYPFYYLFLIQILSVFFILLNAFRHNSGQRRIQISYTIAAYSIGYGGGLAVFLPHYGIPIPPFSLYGILLAHIILVYAIIKHHLLNLKIVLRRAGLLLLVYAFLLICLTPFLFLFHQHYFGDGLISRYLLVEIVLVGSVLSLGPFLYAFFVRRSAYFHEHTVAGITHELKSPLGVIESLLSILMEDVRSPSFDRSKLIDYLGIIQNNTTRLQNFAQNLINVTRNKSDEITLTKQTVDFPQLINAACENWRPLAQQKGIEVKFETSENGSGLISGDSSKLHQIISNLLSNAIKFSDQGTINVSLTRGENEFVCSVKDDGCGIPFPHLKKVFDRFFQARPGSKGTGIGLTIAKAWVEAHGGKIWAESEGEGKGTTVRFTVPGART